MGLLEGVFMGQREDAEGAVWREFDHETSPKRVFTTTDRNVDGKAREGKSRPLIESCWKGEGREIHSTTDSTDSTDEDDGR
jgi:hypothetical protein